MKSSVYAWAMGGGLFLIMEVGAQTGPGSISGLVSDASGSGSLEGVRIRLDEGKTQGIPFADSGVTGPDGKYAFTGLPAKSGPGAGYVLRVNKLGYHSTYIATPFNLQAGENKVVDFPLDKQIVYSLKVGGKGDSPGELDKVLPGVHIVLIPRSTNPPYGLLQALSSTTERDGGARFNELRAGEQQITLAASGYATQVLSRNLDGKTWEESLSVWMEKKPAADYKSVQGRLIKSGNGSVQGMRIFLSASFEGKRLALFAEVTPDLGFAIAGIPAEAAAATLYASPALSASADSLNIALTGMETLVDFPVTVYGPLTLPEPHPKARPDRAGRKVSRAGGEMILRGMDGGIYNTAGAWRERD